jgi:hypothetical protein
MVPWISLNYKPKLRNIPVKRNRVSSFVSFSTSDWAIAFRFLDATAGRKVPAGYLPHSLVLPAYPDMGILRTCKTITSDF